MQIDKHIQMLTELAAKLNKASDDVQHMIMGMESKLLSTNIGLTVWTPGMIHASTDREGVTSGYKVGWARVGSDWRLSFKPVSERDAWCDAAGETVSFERDEGDVQPLTNAPRIVRIEAVGEFERLLRQLYHGATHQLEVLEGVKEFIDGKTDPENDVPF